MKCAGVILLAAALSGCAGVNYIVENYSGVDYEDVAMPDDTYRVFDKPSEGRMMVTSSLSSAAGQGIGRGLLLNSIDTTPPGPLFEAAANQFLVNKGRPECRAVSTALLVQPQFEVRYRCEVAPAPAPAGPAGRRR